jgi:hypothetical protein
MREFVGRSGRFLGNLRTMSGKSPLIGGIAGVVTALVVFAGVIALWPVQQPTPPAALTAAPVPTPTATPLPVVTPTPTPGPAGDQPGYSIPAIGDG